MTIDARFVALRQPDDADDPLTAVLPKSVRLVVKHDLREIWQAPDRATAEDAVDAFAKNDAAKCAKAVACLLKAPDAQLTFYDFPAEHWDDLRTSTPIESVFATVRLRTVRTKGALSQETAHLMVCKLVMMAARRLIKPSPGFQHSSARAWAQLTNRRTANFNLPPARRDRALPHRRRRS
ncbi:transposase [Rhodovastum atsumiense]|uniref:Mutator family transposase n=1 Tax=Rhodovastum atsumiense TaxID=504468 RepID=A0A5M6IRN0_9PROT|nr:hypothetical protein F1189_17325 [Rhodovastum atsumiense]CAH2602110.1 transposase [Rhodovastum atsumiense]